MREKKRGTEMGVRIDPSRYSRGRKRMVLELAGVIRSSVVDRRGCWTELGTGLPWFSTQ